MRLNLKSVKECWAFPIFRVEVNISIEFIDNQLADHQSQTYTVGIELLFFIFYASEHFKKFILILLFNSDAVVYDRQFDKIVGALFDIYDNFAKSICKFERICYKI